MSFVVCPCCVPGVLIGGVLVTWIFCQVVGNVVMSSSDEKKSSGLFAKVIAFLSKSLGVLLILIAILLGLLERNEDLRKLGFSLLCSTLSQGNELDVLRCGLLEEIHGRVLEIGPGPATNFRCLYPPTDITEWVGVEPNNYFVDSIEEQKLKWNITFDTSLTWLRGEDIDVEDETFDAVIGTHVLCSVDDVDKVLRQVSRVLKPGGTYYFLEHVLATEKQPIIQLLQIIFGPVFKIIGNGCEFRELWKNVDTNNKAAGLSDFDIDLRHMQAPLGIPFLRPHIIGKAFKRAIQ